MKSLKRKRKKEENKKTIIHSGRKSYLSKTKNKRSKRKRTNKAPEGVKSSKLAIKCPFAYEQGVDYDLYQECDYCKEFKACRSAYRLLKRTNKCN